jgi:hypothetical protein
MAGKNTITWRTILLGNLLLLLLIYLALQAKYPEMMKEYELYFKEQRPIMQLDFRSLSQDWTESELKTQFASYKINCYASNPGNTLGQRTCTTDLQGFNGHSAMLGVFYFRDGKLDAASVNVPWWAHAGPLESLAQMYGPPTSKQFAFYAGIRLLGWQLSDGSAVFYNRERPFNLMDPNKLLWHSARHCAQRRCFRY